jgi:hypothetical protein
VRRRRSMLPRMRELTVIYGYGGSWPVSVAVRMMSRSDSHYRQVLLTALRRKPPSWTPPTTPSA